MAAMGRRKGHRAAAWLALLLAGTLLFLSGFIYSPWHEHDRLGKQSCTLCQFGHLSSPQPSHQIELPSLTFHARLDGYRQPILVSSAAVDREYSRSPPA